MIVVGYLFLVICCLFLSIYILAIHYKMDKMDKEIKQVEHILVDVVKDINNARLFMENNTNDGK